MPQCTKISSSCNDVKDVYAHQAAQSKAAVKMSTATVDINCKSCKSAHLQGVHDQIIEILLVSEEVAELLGHELLHTCLLSADKALNHHAA